MRALHRYQAESAAIPEGAAGEIVRILRGGHRGKIHAILGADLLEELRLRGYRLSSRQLMQRVADLRADGALIGASNADGGYYWIVNQDELDAFFSKQIWSRITSLREVYEAMKAQAEIEFSNEPVETPVQLSLFEEV